MKITLTGLVIPWLLLSNSSVNAADPNIPDHEWSANIGLTSDYLFRGMSRSSEDPAIQGGIDYKNVLYGFRAGMWASSIEFDSRASNDSSVEIDLYGGYFGRFSSDVTWDIVGVYQLFPDQNVDFRSGDFEYFEIDGELAYTFTNHLYVPTVSANIAYSPEYFGEDDDSIYLSTGIDFKLPEKFGFYSRVGYLDVSGGETNPRGYDYAHYQIGLTKTLGIVTLDLSWNDAENGCEQVSMSGKDYCQAAVFSVLSFW